MEKVCKNCRFWERGASHLYKQTLHKETKHNGFIHCPPGTVRYIIGGGPGEYRKSFDDHIKHLNMFNGPDDAGITEYVKPVSSKFGECTNPKMRVDPSQIDRKGPAYGISKGESIEFMAETTANDEVDYSIETTDPHSTACIWPGENFGCIHFQPKD